MPAENAIPGRDGAVGQFVSDEARNTRWFDAGRKVIFINGMSNSGQDHHDSAVGLSLLQMCPVVGVYNQTGGFITDLSQCIADKYQFDGPAARTPAAALDNAIGGGSPGVPRDRGQAMERVLERNPAALAMFRLLRQAEHRNSPVFAHSQGNLILSNALSAVAAVDGERALQGREIRTFGSPAVNWPAPIRPLEAGFTFDPVTWLAGFDWSLSISKVGMPQGSLNVVTHGFSEYMNNDPAFVINRCRWGGLGVTFSMDENRLADTLVDMGRNMPRVRGVFERLRSAHPSDVDDVAKLYVEKLRTAPTGGNILQALKADTALHRLLMAVMEAGWTSGRERTAIDFLASL